MPALGDQHNTVVPNPYEEQRPRVMEYTAKEIAILQSRLEKQLGPEYISARQGPSGQKVHYITAEKCITLANEVFGFNGWSSSIKEVVVDFCDESREGRVTLGLSVIMRVTLRDGSYHEDIGYGHIENAKGKAVAFEKAKKEGTTDALKRTLRNFGNILGNCIYDKDYLAKVTKIKVKPTKFSEENLHRHADYAVKQEPHIENDPLKNNKDTVMTDIDENEFDTGDFDEADFGVGSDDENPDEIALPSNNVGMNGPRHTGPQTSNQQRAQAPQNQAPNNRSAAPMAPAPQRPQPPQTPNQNRPQPPRNPAQMPQNVPQPIRNQPQPPQRVMPPRSAVQNNPHTMSTTAQTSSTDTGGSENPPVAFFTARVADTVQDSTNLKANLPTFNPHAESPSIRRTAGIDHTKSAAIPRELLNGGAQPSNQSPSTSNTNMMPKTNFVNPQTDSARRLGMPGGGLGSPLQNRSSFKPPGKRQSDTTRPPLGDVTNTGGNVNGTTNVMNDDAKRVKHEVSENAGQNVAK